MTVEIEENERPRFELKTLFLATTFVAICVAFAKQVFPNLAEFPTVVAVAISLIGGLFVAGFALVAIGTIVIAWYPQLNWARRVIHTGGYLMASAFPMVFAFAALYNIACRFFAE